MSSMHASRVHRFGAPDVIVFEQIAVPEPGPGQIRVQVAAAGVGPWDGWVRSGRSQLAQTLPLTLGSDIAGIVEAVGPGVSERVLGERVFGVTNRQFTGGYAEFAVANARSIARLPEAIDFISAASMPVVAVTAWQMLFKVARIERGQRVLIHGAAGSVGAYALQLALAAGTTTIASVLAADAERIRKMGADSVIETDAQPAGALEGRVDAVIDLVGGASQAQLFGYLRPGGVLVSAISEPDAALAQARGVRATFFLVDVTTADLDSVASLVERGRLCVRVGRVLPLESARQAHEMLEGLHAKSSGKIVLEVQRAETRS